MRPACSLSLPYATQGKCFNILRCWSKRIKLAPWRVQTVMTIVDTVVSRTNTQVADSAKVLQSILAAAANERGEWELPLSAEKALPLPKAWELLAVHAGYNLRQQGTRALAVCPCKTSCSILGAVY